MPPTAVQTQGPANSTPASCARPDLAEPAAVAEVGTVYVTALGGAIDAWMLIVLHRRIAEALDLGDDRVVLDLSAVTVLGGQAVGVLFGVLRRLARRGATIAVVGGPPHVQSVLERCSIDGLELYATGDAALMALRLSRPRRHPPVSASEPGSGMPLSASRQ